MRIPLDYYRILSVPVKATLEQLKQAYEDRLLQQPRREYSKYAIEARQKLIEHSYEVLSNPEQRAIYDAQFLVNMQPLKTSESSNEESADSDVEVEDSPAANLPNPTIEISDSQLVGALLILHELGEYELVLKIGIDFYNSSEFAPSSPDELTVNHIQDDLILTLTLAYLELGREQWHRQEYEHAAISGQMGIDLLKQTNLFPQIRQELELDLNKLRPYRVLELISQNPAKSDRRAKGFKLLHSMLLQRQGIEGKGCDRSGLSFDQFLCFVQQLRTYLTSAEQQQLFDDENQSESAIANYLAVYALLGRGFSLKQPELVLRASRKLDALSELQGVGWEQAITALLLGHTEKAIDLLRNASDSSRLEQVEQHSSSSIDLLPGLCFYGEKWLHEDVIAQFSDLTTTQLTLKEYFADRQVQSYLEKLVPAPSDKTKVNRHPAPKAYKKTEAAQTGIMSLWRNVFPTEKTRSLKANVSSREITPTLANAAKSNLGTATIERDYPNVVSGKVRQTNVLPTERISKGNSKRHKSLSLPLQPDRTRAVPESVIQKAHKINRKRNPRRKKNTATLWKGWLFMIGLVLGVGTLGFVTTRLLLTSSTKTAKAAQLAIALDRPAIELPPKKIEPVAAKPEPTFAEQSGQTIQIWLDSKSAAFGKKHQVERLNDILAEPLLSTWRNRALTYKQGNFYREYEHKLSVRSATIDPNDKNRATIEAEVREVAKHYQSGKLDNTQSYDDDLLVRYQLIRKEDRWLIKNTEVLKTL